VVRTAACVMIVAGAVACKGRSSPAEATTGATVPIPLASGSALASAARWRCSTTMPSASELGVGEESQPRLLWDLPAPILACRKRDVPPIGPPAASPPQEPLEAPTGPAPWSCTSQLLWVPPAEDRGALTGLAMDGSRIYVKQNDTCRDGDRGPRRDGGIWRIDRATGHAERILRTGYLVNEMQPAGPALWLTESTRWCQRFQADQDGEWIGRVPVDGGEETRAKVSARGLHIQAAMGGHLYYTSVGDLSGIAVLDEDSMGSRILALGLPFVSAVVGDYFYFLDGEGPRTSVCRVPRWGGDAEVVKDGEGDRALLSARRRAGEIQIARDAIVYVAGPEGHMDVRATRVTGGSSWQLAPPYRHPAHLVADDEGVFWINVVPDKPSVDGVFACVPETKGGGR
jgi:hypothetical protein